MGADRRTPLPVPNGRQSADTRNASEKTNTLGESVAWR